MEFRRKLRRHSFRTCVFQDLENLISIQIRKSFDLRDSSLIFLGDHQFSHGPIVSFRTRWPVILSHTMLAARRRAVRELSCLFASEVLVRDAPSDDLLNCHLESIGVSHFAIVIPERLLIEVAKKMERFHGDIRSVNLAFQQAKALLSQVYHCPLFAFTAAAAVSERNSTNPLPGPPSWTRCMDPVHEPAAWTPFVDPVLGFEPAGGISRCSQGIS